MNIDELRAAIGTTTEVTDNGTEYPKPPLGVLPERLWKEQRAKDLARAIYDYIAGGFIGGSYATGVVLWCRELERLMSEIEHEEKDRLKMIGKL